MPLLLLGFRDEFTGRPWRPPARHWPGSPLVGGRDEEAGGSWLALHPDLPRVSCLLNGRVEQPPPPKKPRSRGELPLLAAADGEQALKQLQEDHATLTDLNPFFLICADPTSVLMLSWTAPEPLSKTSGRAPTSSPTPATPIHPPPKTTRPGTSAPGSPRTGRTPTQPPPSRTPGANGSRWPAATTCPATTRPRSSPAGICPTAGCGARRRSAWSPSAPTVSATTSSPSPPTRPAGIPSTCARA